jgi:Cys-tRNA(Pro)/Cys-tRNA(Cys) deacylase
MSTRAIAVLKRHKADFEVVRYRHDEKGAAFAAAATGTPIDLTIKTLVADLGNGFALALMPGGAQLNLKRLASAMGVKRAAMADTDSAERLTGYKVGGISPFGTRQRLPAVMDRRLLAAPRVLINAGQRGVMVALAPGTIVDVLGCKVADLADDAPGR